MSVRLSSITAFTGTDNRSTTAGLHPALLLSLVLVLALMQLLVVESCMCTCGVPVEKGAVDSEAKDESSTPSGF